MGFAQRRIGGCQPRQGWQPSVESVAALPWNQWQLSPGIEWQACHGISGRIRRGIGGSFGVEYAGWNQLTKQPGGEGARRSVILSLLVDHGLFFHPDQHAQLKNNLPAYTVGRESTGKRASRMSRRRDAEPLIVR